MRVRGCARSDVYATWVVLGTRSRRGCRRDRRRRRTTFPYDAFNVIHMDRVVAIEKRVKIRASILALGNFLYKPRDQYVYYDKLMKLLNPDYVPK